MSPTARYWETWMKFVRDDMFNLGYVSSGRLFSLQIVPHCAGRD